VSRKLTYILLTLGLPIIAFALWVQFPLQARNPDFENLQAKADNAISIARAESASNGYLSPVFTELFDTAGQSTATSRPLHRWVMLNYNSDVDIEDSLAEVRPTLDKLAEAMEKPVFFSNEGQGEFLLTPLSLAVEAICARARWRFRSQDTAAGVADLQLGLGFSLAVAKPNSLFAIESSLDVQNRVLNVFLALSPQTPISADDWKALSHSCAQSVYDSEFLAQGLAAESREIDSRVREQFEAQDLGILWRLPGMQSREVRIAQNVLQQQAVDIAKGVPLHFPGDTVPSLTELWKGQEGVVTDLVLPPAAALDQEFQRHRRKMWTVGIVASVYAYRGTMGSFPVTLEELVDQKIGIDLVVDELASSATYQLQGDTATLTVPLPGGPSAGIWAHQPRWHFGNTILIEAGRIVVRFESSR
jgi:hypothetical protein